MKTEEIVRKVRSEITVGMSRADVEQRLSALPVSYVYVPRARLEITGQTTFEGKPLSGRFDVLTPHEPQFSYMKQAAIFIELDQQEQVVNVRIDPSGFVLEEPTENSEQSSKANP
ncbi:MAG: hypothetical protein ACREF4_13095 [Gammaproteobacteria bacterium]